MPMARIPCNFLIDLKYCLTLISRIVVVVVKEFRKPVMTSVALVAVVRAFLHVLAVLSRFLLLLSAMLVMLAIPTGIVAATFRAIAVVRIGRTAGAVVATAMTLLFLVLAALSLFAAGAFALVIRAPSQDPVPLLVQLGAIRLHLPLIEAVQVELVVVVLLVLLPRGSVGIGQLLGDSPFLLTG